MGYLNKHHSDLLAEFAKAFSSVGTEMAKQNAWSGGSYIIDKCEITSISTQLLELQVTIQIRGNDKPKMEIVTVDLDADVIPERQRRYRSRPLVPSYKGVELAAIDLVVRKLCRLCWMVQSPSVTGKLIQLAIQLGGDGVGKVPENMYLNQ